MTRRTDFKSAITYTGQRLTGIVHLSYKIDGIRLLSRVVNGERVIVTRNNKIPVGIHNLSWGAKSKIEDYGDCELWTGDFAQVQGGLSTKSYMTEKFGVENIYPLEQLDLRLDFNTLIDPSPSTIKYYLDLALKYGYEGLILRTDNGNWYRVKPSYTADIYITGVFEQQDIHGFGKNCLGGFNTNYGNVTAFTDHMREVLWIGARGHVGKLMEVTYKELYPNGSFRYAVKFNRFRTDKDTESFDTKSEPPTIGVPNDS